MSDPKVIAVRVAVRARPLIDNELAEACQTCIKFVPGEPQLVLGKDKAFTFDYVYNMNDAQEDTYGCVKDLVQNIFNGYNATVLAYGQTSSGKTYTMGGCYEESLRQDEEQMGVIPRVLRDLFCGIDNNENSKFTIRVSYLEIHNEDIHDLLCPLNEREPLSIREDIDGGIRIPGLREITVSSMEETMTCLINGSQWRTTGSTAMNKRSSRSHAIFTIHVEQLKITGDVEDLTKSKFHLVDLAGSERAKRTRAEGERFKEGVNINRGLLSLGNVISALGEDSQKRNHIPYRDSKLTRILQDSLGGNSHTVMIACVSPADSNLEETLNTLRYADRARKIKNKPIVNRDPQAAEILRLKELVQQLQVEGLGGGGRSDICSDLDSDDYKKLLDRVKTLEDENSKLSKELQHSVDQSTYMCEKVIILELARDKLKKRIDELKSQTGIDLSLLSTSVDAEGHPELKHQLEMIKKLTDNINNAETQDDDLESIFSPDKSQNDPEDTDQSPEMDSDPSSPQSTSISTHYALRQAQMGRELEELNKLLSKKQELASQMLNNDDKMHTMKLQYELSHKEMESEINSLQKEKEDLNDALTNAKANTAANKVSEQRRKRLQELEQQIGQLKRKMQEQTKMLKFKDQSDKQVNKLNTDIQSLKQQRVKLMKQLKEDGDTFRKWKQQKDKEVIQLQQKDRKRQFEIVKLQREKERQQTICKRKAEEAAAANKRLKEALAKQKLVLAERSQKLEKYDNTNIGNRVRQWLSHELEVQVSVREAKYHLTSLLTDRTQLSKELKAINLRLEDEPPKKRLAWVTAEGVNIDTSMEIEDMKKQAKVLEHEIELRNLQITDLQQKILDAEQDGKGKATWESLHTMVEAKCALKWLLEQTVCARTDSTKIHDDLKDVVESKKETAKSADKYESNIRTMAQKHESAMTRMQRQYEDKVLFLLRQVKSVKRGENTGTLDEETMQRMKFQEAEIDRLSSLHDDLQKKIDECDGLKKELTVAKYRGARASLMPLIKSPGGSPFFSPVKAVKPKAKKSASVEELSDESFEDESDEYEDDDNDSDWHKTPMVKRQKKLTQRAKNESTDSSENRVSLTRQCACKGLCNNNACGCKKNSKSCDENCKCKVSKCKNREITAPESTTNDSDAENTDGTVVSMNSTFNVDSTTVIMDKDTPTSTTGIKTEFKRPARNILGSSRLVNNDNSRSSDEFVRPHGKSTLDSSTEDSNNGSSISSGSEPKRRRKLLSKNASNSFFSPLV